MKNNPDFHCLLNLHTGANINDPVYGIEAVFCDDKFNILSEYASPLNVYEQKYLGYTLNIKEAADHHKKEAESINNTFNVIVTVNNMDEILRFNKEEETGETATTLFWTDSRLGHLEKYNDLILRLCNERNINPYEFYINKFLGRCYITKSELTKCH